MAPERPDYYVPRTDPIGPVDERCRNSIDSSTLGTPGCASFVYTERSYQPFIRDVFHQFSETSTGGAFTFMTGIGGFLQEFLYGYSGMRFGTDSVALAPSLTAQLQGVVLNNVLWHGRQFTVTINRKTTTLTLTSGGPLAITTPSAGVWSGGAAAWTLLTARPDLTRHQRPSQLRAHAWRRLRRREALAGGGRRQYRHRLVPGHACRRR